MYETLDDAYPDTILISRAYNQVSGLITQSDRNLRQSLDGFALLHVKVKSSQLSPMLRKGN